jgi:hypothetical protein
MDMFTLQEGMQFMNMSEHLLACASSKFRPPEYDDEAQERGVQLLFE